MGGGGSTRTTTQIIQPTPPPQPSTADAIREYVSALPRIFQTQLQFAPQEAAQQVQLAQQYALPLAQAAKTAQDTLYPETATLQEQLAGEASRGIQQGISPELRSQYESDIRANLGTNVGSPIGAEFTARSLLRADEDFKRYYRDLALSVAGRQPLAQPTQPNYTNQLAQFNPGQVLGFQSQNYNAFANASRPIPIQNSFGTTKPNYSSFIPNFGFNFGGG